MTRHYKEEDYQSVQFASYTPEYSQYEETNEFAFREDKKYHLLQKTCIWTLKKLGCYAKRKKVKYNICVVKPDTFMQKLFEQRKELTRHWNLGAKRIFVGYEDYHKIVNELKTDPVNWSILPEAFSFETRYTTRDCKHEYLRGEPKFEIHGLTVEVVPWMKGVLVMP